MSVGEINEAVVGTIEKLLEMARSGELQSFIGTGFVFNGDRMAVWVDTEPNIYKMLGALGWLKAEYIERHIDV